MKESPNKRGKKQNRLLWLLLVLLAVCLAVLLFLYGQQNNYALLQDASSNAEGTTSSEETASQKEETNSRENSSRRSSGTSSRRTSSTAGSRVEETASSSPVESLPEEMGGGTTPILPAPGTSGSTSSSPSGSSGTPSDSSSTPEQETPVRRHSANGLTLQWETDSQSPFAQLWMDYASQQSLFGVLEGQGTPVTVHLHASAGTDFVTWNNGYDLHCYAGSSDMAQVYRGTALLLEEVLRQKGLWESSVSDFQSQNPRGFTYGSPNQAYVGLYFHSMEAQQTLEEDRLESWELVLQESTPRYGGLMEKCRGLTNLYRLIVAK